MILLLLPEPLALSRIRREHILSRSPSGCRWAVWALWFPRTRWTCRGGPPRWSPVAAHGGRVGGWMVRFDEWWMMNEWMNEWMMIDWFKEIIGKSLYKRTFLYSLSSHPYTNDNKGEIEGEKDTGLIPETKMTHPSIDWPGPVESCSISSKTMPAR